MKKILLAILFLCVTVPAQVAPGDPGAVPIEFRFNHVVVPPDSGVGVNGSMNGWTNGVFRMRPTEPNLYRVTLDLLPLTYEYKFVTFTDTVGQAGVTGYYTDPLNPRLGGPFNNSYLTVGSPMIYYLLPKSGGNVTNRRPEITANISWAYSHQIDASSFVFKIDNAEIPNAGNYFNLAERFFSYLPAAPFTNGPHTVYLKCALTNGDTVSLSSTFTIIEDNSSKPFTFSFDSKSPSFNFLSPVNRVDVKGSFNQNGQNLMTDPDNDGIYTYTTNLIIDEPNEYTVIVNTGSYINDPDNPLLSTNHRTIAVRSKRKVPVFGPFMPHQGSIFNYPGTDTVIITGSITKGDTNITVNASSIKALMNGSPLPLTTSSITDGYGITVKVPVTGAGRYAVEFQGKDIYGNSAKSFMYHFVVKPAVPAPGYVYYDGEDDDKGTGTYKMPAGVDSGSVDIRGIRIYASANYDSLRFEVELQKISVYTRLGFMITHDLTSLPAELPMGVKLRVPDWKNKGVMIVLALPGSSFVDTMWENRLLISRDPLTLSLKPQVSAAGGNTFHFSLPLDALNGILGTYNDTWSFLAWSYLKNAGGTVKVGAALGGADYAEATNVYDIGFIGSTTIQEKLLANSRSSAMVGGAQIPLIGKDARGAGVIKNTMIHPQLGALPVIDIYAGGGVLYTDSVFVYGKAGVPQGSQITIKNMGNSFVTVTGADSIFSKKISLQPGVNSIHAEYGTGVQTSFSPTIIYTYEPEDKPVVSVYSVTSGGVVTLIGDGSVNQGGGTLQFAWSQDSLNPAQVNLSSTTGSTTSFPVPAVAGDYYFTLKATNTANKSAWGRTVVSVSGGNAVRPDYTTWNPAWADTSIIYSIFVRTFDESGTFTGIKNRLLELKDLGVDILWLLPVHPTTGNLGPDNPGYATTNYFDVLPQYGTKEEFKQFVDAAHSYGIKVILDHVIQHTSDLHPHMKDAIRYKQFSPYYPFYMWDANGNFQYLFTWVDLPSINFGAASTRDYLLKAAKFWVQDFNVDGFRCDVAWAINDLRPEGPAYWQQWRSELKQMKPDIFLMAEADAVHSRYFDAKFDAAYDWSLFSTLRSIVSGTTTITQLDSVVQFYQGSGFPAHAQPFRFLENQDEQRFLEAFGLAKTKLASAFIFAMPGIPSLYAGQEVGELTFRGNIRWNDPLNLRKHYKRIIQARRKNAALHSGDYLRVSNDKPSAVYTVLRRSGSSNAILNYNFSSSQQVVTIQVPIALLAFDSTATFYLNDEVNRVSYQVTGVQLKNYQITVPGNTAQIFILSNEPLTDAEEEKGNIPEVFTVSQNYPNPFNPTTSIRYSLPEASMVRVQIFNVLGERVDELINAELSAGIYEANWNASRFASGIYFVSVEAKPVSGGQKFYSTRKMILMK